MKLHPFNTKLPITPVYNNNLYLSLINGNVGLAALHLDLNLNSYRSLLFTLRNYLYANFSTLS